jgi:hypothetical protein
MAVEELEARVSAGEILEESENAKSSFPHIGIVHEDNRPAG